jgi:hypothetical protein
MTVTDGVMEEVLKESEAHRASCSATDHDRVVRNRTWDFEVSFYATQKG